MEGFEGWISDEVVFDIVVRDGFNAYVSSRRQSLMLVELFVLVLVLIVVLQRMVDGCISAAMQREHWNSPFLTSPTSTCLHFLQSPTSGRSVLGTLELDLDIDCCGKRSG